MSNALSSTTFSLNLTVGGACTPTPSVPALSPLSISQLGKALEQEALTAVNQVYGVLGADISGIYDQLKSIVSQIEALINIPISLPLGPTLGVSAFASVLEGIVNKFVQQLITQVENLVLSEAEGLIVGAVTSALNTIEAIAIGELQKDLGPVFQALAIINGVLGQLQADKMLVQSVFNALGAGGPGGGGCAAKAELLAEVYFKAK